MQLHLAPLQVPTEAPPPSPAAQTSHAVWASMSRRCSADFAREAVARLRMPPRTHCFAAGLHAHSSCTNWGDDYRAPLTQPRTTRLSGASRPSDRLTAGGGQSVVRRGAEEVRHAPCAGAGAAVAEGAAAGAAPAPAARTAAAPPGTAPQHTSARLGQRGSGWAQPQSPAWADGRCAHERRVAASGSAGAHSGREYRRNRGGGSGQSNEEAAASHPGGLQLSMAELRMMYIA